MGDWDLWLDAGNTSLLPHVRLLGRESKGRHFMTRREGEEAGDVFLGDSLFR
jgi:hypothetical protein